jgi:hypothetical protein
MLLNLITPLMLATAPQSVDASALSYDHLNQIAVSNGHSTKEQIAYQSTRTYDFRGFPNDSDFD